MDQNGQRRETTPSDVHANFQLNYVQYKSQKDKERPDYTSFSRNLAETFHNLHI